MGYVFLYGEVYFYVFGMDVFLWVFLCMVMFLYGFFGV